jgi:hypothetical protein
LLVALALAAVAFTVSSRRSLASGTREFAIRAPLSADTQTIVRLVVGRGVTPMTIGVRVGGALTAARVVSSLLSV